MVKIWIEALLHGASPFFAIRPQVRRNKVSFNNKVEHKEAPVSLSGGQVLQQYESFEQVTFGRATCKKRKQHEEDNRWHNWRKKSIFLVFRTSLHCLYAIILM